MTKEQLKDIIEWDIVNWSKALPFWEKNVDLDSKKLKCLELGGRRGGLSLWLGLKGHHVICSDYNSPEKTASLLHQRYNLTNVSYQSINATSIDSTNEFDIVIFKSIIGSVCKKGENKLKQVMINQIYTSLKPGGKLLFAENLTSSFLHRFFRRYFTKWGKNWNYLSYNEIDGLFSSFKKLEYFTIGFFAAFGRTEKQRNFLSKLDSSLNWLIPKNKRYIVIGIAKK